jgi:hypothetical protein
MINEPVQTHQVCEQHIEITKYLKEEAETFEG